MIRSPLFEEIRNYLKTADPEKQIFLYVPYIKTKVLSKLVKDLENKITIITTWHMNDLLSPFASSELELYPFCKENNIALYINNKIHLKVYSVSLESAIVATGNISQGGLEGVNEECAVLVNELSSTDRLFFEKIRNESTYVDDDVYQKHLERYEELVNEVPKQIEYEDLVIVPKKDHFLKSALPMTRNVDDLIEGYENINSGLKPSENSETCACIYHDLTNYNIESGLSNEEFLKGNPDAAKTFQDFVENHNYYRGEKESYLRDIVKMADHMGEIAESIGVVNNWDKIRETADFPIGMSSAVRRGNK